MSKETSLDFNDGYLQCLNDLNLFGEIHINSVSEYKTLRDKFIVPKMEEYNKNIGKILDEMYSHYKKQHPNG